MAEPITCPSCAAPVSPPAGRTQFFCAHCGATVVVPDDHRRAAADAPMKPVGDLSRFTIEKSGDELSVRWRWRSCGTLLLVPFALFWNGFIAVWIAAAASTGEPLFALFGIPFVVVGIGLAYLAVALQVNGTTVRVRDGVLSVEHGPLPWKAPEPIPADRLSQLYVKERVRRGKNGPHTDYQLMAVRDDGTERALLTDSTDGTQRAVERMLEVHLGLEDRAVAGEA